MTIISIEGGQGSPAWLARRAERLPNGLPARWHASDAPAMMGVSPYETRSQLLARLRSGIEKEIGDYQQKKVIDPGHEFEARARPLAELLLDDDLSPVLVEEGRISASLDGRTLDGDHFEHKRLRVELRDLLPDIGAAISGPEFGRALPLAHRIQIAHQHLADQDCERTLFGATDWWGDELLAQRWCWVERNDRLCAEVFAGWVQFEKDLLAYVPPEAKPEVVAAAQEHLPAVSVRVSGSLAVASNLADLAPRLRAYIDGINKAPSTDQEFADVGAAGKRLREVQAAIKERVDGALATIADVNELLRLGNELGEMARQAAIACEKAAGDGKDAIKKRELMQRQAALVIHVVTANGRLGGPYIQPQTTTFATVVKGLSSLDSYRDKLDTELARQKIECDALEAKITDNLATIAQAGAPALFADKAQLVLKDAESVAAIVAQRLADEEKRLEAERERIRAEEAARAEREAAAKVAAQAAPAPAAAPGAKTGHSQGPVSDTGAPAAAADSPVKLADICARLGWSITKAQVHSLGVPTHHDKRTALLAAADIPRLKAALRARVDAL